MVLTGCLQREYHAVLSFLAPLPLRDRKRTDEVKFEALEEGGRICEREEMEPYILLFYFNMSFSAVLTWQETKKAKMFRLSFCLSTHVSQGFNA